VELDLEHSPPFVDDLGGGALATAVAQSIAFYERQATTAFVVGGRSYTGAEFAAALRRLTPALDPGSDAVAFQEALRANFRVLKATGQGQPVRFTGYYTPVLRGRLARGGTFQYPLYARPPDLMSFDMAAVFSDCDCATGIRSGRLANGTAVPYYTRAQIDGARVLSDQGLEIAWTDDPVGLFFLHIQGSGQILLPDGRRVHANYAATNGLPFRSIGPILAKQAGLPPGGGSMQAMRAYLDTHPEQRDKVLYENPRYTFFRLADDGPFGSTQVKLTAGRSIATDPGFFPPGALVYVRTRVPVVDRDRGELVTWQPLTRLVLNQDKGAAIKGPARVDIYFGAGEDAEATAGRMSAVGELYVLVPLGGTPAWPEAQTARRGGSGSAGRPPLEGRLDGGRPRRLPMDAQRIDFRPTGRRQLKPIAGPDPLPIRYVPAPRAG
jgi:membrane-bound lytic murein transglycosylase A